MICGDKYPIISNLNYLGLISALSNVKPRNVISELKGILKKDPDFFQYILKIIPIDFACKTDIKVISQLVENNYKDFINENETFRIRLKRRKNELIDRNNLIKSVAARINNNVNLDNPDKTIRIELLGDFCGISFLKSGDILRLGKRNDKT